MASFQAKIRGETLRTGENKNYRHVPCQTDAQSKIPKKQGKNLKKLQEYHCGFISSQNTLKKAEKDGKQKLSFRFVPTRHVIENSKNIEKKFQKFKNTFVAAFQAIIGWNRPRNRENKNYDFASFQPDA